jgi:opacity protein-like surface antigen
MKIRTFLPIVLMSLVPSGVLAQDGRGASVSANVSALSLDTRAEVSFSGAFMFHVSRVVGFEIEATVAPKLRSPFSDDDFYIATPAIFPSIFPRPQFQNDGGRLVILSNNVRIAVPTTSNRLEPYFVAGGGIANVRRTADIIYPLFDPAILGSLVGLGLAPPSSSGSASSSFSYPLTTSSVEMALTIGGGLSVRVNRQMSVDADLRMFRLLGQTDRSVGRFGVGVRYRF